MPPFFDQIITVYGRKPVLEVLQDASLQCFRLHFADSNKPAPILRQMEEIATRRNVEICTHGKKNYREYLARGHRTRV